MIFSTFTMVSLGEESVNPDTRANVGTKFYFNKTFAIDRNWNTDDVSVVVFVQSTTKVRKNTQNPQYQYDSYEAIQSTIDFLDTSVRDTGNQRRVLGECFTATWCGYCPGSVGAHDRLANDPNYFPDHYTLIEWHASSSGNGLANADATARFNFYNWGGAIPFSVFDGVIGHIGGSTNSNDTTIDTTYKNYIDGRKVLDSPVSIKTFGKKDGANSWINATIEVKSIPTDELYKVTFVIVEDIKVDKNNDPWQGGNASQAIYRYHARKVINSHQINLGNAAPVISQDYPVGGEVVTGDMQINWSASDEDDDPITITIDYRKGSGTWTNIANEIANSGSYVWDTTTVDDGTNYRLRILAKDTAGKEALDSMGPTFEIRNDFDPTVTLTSPVGGELWSGTQTITWAATDDRDADGDITVSLHYTRDDENFLVIYTNMVNTGSYDWDTTLVVDDDSYRVRVTARDTKGQEATGISPQTFELYNENYEDSDNDGMPDFWEDLHDLDVESASDAIEDKDGDYLKNIEEYQHGTDPNNADTDGDGMWDGWELQMGLDPQDDSDPNFDPDDDGLTNLLEFQHGTFPDDEDSDDDGMPDGWEIENGFMPLELDANFDLDDDGLSNLMEYQMGTDPNEEDTDSDGMPDDWEVDYGLDPIADSDAEMDLDNDGLSNADEFEKGTHPDDPDMDDDGMPDGWEVEKGKDPLDQNDAYADDDADGLNSLAEFLNGTDPFAKDSDGDGMEDGWEVKYGLDPVDPADATGDLDNDTVNNLEEFKKGIKPDNEDSDGDGMPDGWELEYDLKPNDKRDADEDEDEDEVTNLDEYKKGTYPTKKDSDSDGLPDGWELKYGLDPSSKADATEDPDGDGKSNLDEFKGGFDPTVKNVKSGGDADDDGFPIWSIVIAVIIVSLGVGALVVAMVLRSKKSSEEDYLGRVAPGQESKNDYEALYGTHEPSESGRTEVISTPIVTGESQKSDPNAPPCPKCGVTSTFYPEYECHWCGPCQDYVFPSESQKPIAASPELDTKRVVRRRVIK